VRRELRKERGNIDDAVAVLGLSRRFAQERDTFEQAYGYKHYLPINAMSLAKAIRANETVRKLYDTM
jgi:hypothetical protein